MKKAVALILTLSFILSGVCSAIALSMPTQSDASVSAANPTDNSADSGRDTQKYF